MNKIFNVKPVLDEQEVQAVKRVFESGQFVKGEENKKLEQEFATFCATKYAVTVNSGTMALIIALKALGIKSGDEVITAPNSFMASANAIQLAGAKAVFSDINLDTLNLDPNLLEKAITSKTKAIMPVHLYGYPANMDEILEIAKKHNLKVIEDACQSHGAEYKNKKIGSIGDIGAFSLFPTKNITSAGEGGIITTNDETLAKISKSLTNHGRADNPNDTAIFGYNARLSEIHAAIARIQLSKLKGHTAKRRELADIYARELKGISQIKLPFEDKNKKHVYHAYTILTEDRDGLRTFLNENNVGCAVRYPYPIHLQTAYKKDYKKGEFPNAEQACEQILLLPMYPGLTEENVLYVCEKIRKYYS